MAVQRDSEEWQFVDALHAIHMMAKNEDIASYYAEYFSKEQLSEYMSMTGFVKVHQTKPTGAQMFYWALYQKPVSKTSNKAIESLNREWAESLPLVKQMKYHTIYYNASKDDIEVVMKSQIKQTEDVDIERKEIARDRVVILLEYKKPGSTKIKKPVVAQQAKSIRITADAKEIEESKATGGDLPEDGSKPTMLGGDSAQYLEENIPYSYNPEEEAKENEAEEKAIDLLADIQDESAAISDVKVIEGTSLPEFIDTQVSAPLPETSYSNKVDDTIQMSQLSSFGFEQVKPTKEVLDLDMEESDDE
jgi:hypothetical protein